MIKNVLYFAENALSDIQGGGIVARWVLRGLPAKNLLGFYQYKTITIAPEYIERFIYLGVAKPFIDFDWRMPEWYKSIHRVLRAVKLRFLSARLITFMGVYRPEFFFKRDVDFCLQEIAMRGYKPEIIYFAGGSLRYMYLAVQVAKKLDLPMVVLHMDDTLERDSLSYWPKQYMRDIWREKTLGYMREAAARTLVGTTNSPHLAAKMEAETGFKFTAANNCNPDLRLQLPEHPEPREKRDYPVIVYTGALNLGLQGGTLLRFARAISELNFEGVRCRLDVYTPVEFAPLINAIRTPGVVEYRGHVGPAALAQAYQDADFCVLTTAFFGPDFPFFKNSLATKLSDYLCMGKPVISVGNKEWAVHDYVTKNICGFTIFDETREAMKKRIREVLAAPQYVLDTMSKSNRTLWERQHDVRVMARPTREAIGLPPL